jgi:hypothetical protein
MSMLNENEVETTSLIEEDEFKAAFESPFKEEKKFDLNSTDTQLIYGPTGKYKDVVHFTEVLEDEELLKEIDKLDLKEDDYTSFYVAKEGMDKTYRDGVFDSIDLSNGFTQRIRVDGKDLAIRRVPVKTKSKSNLSGKRLKLAFSEYLGVSGIVQIPLFNSGFWIMLNPITEAKIIDLEVRIGKNLIKLGRDTNGAVFSNDSVIYNEILMDFIMDNIASSTLDLDDDDDIRDYIDMRDFNTLILGLVESISPKGFNTVLSCKNVLNFDKESGVKCNFTLSANVDPKLLLFVNKSFLTDRQLKIMSMRNPNTISKDTVKEYMNESELGKDKVVNVKTSVGSPLTITLKTPNVKEHIEHGVNWVESIINMVDELLEEDTSEEARSYKIEQMSKTSMLHTYIHFIKSIETDTGIKASSYNDISEVLELITMDRDAFTSFVEEVRKYISENVLTMIGTPVYTCPECKEDQQVNEDDSPFKEIIPLNIVSTFFDLGALKKVIMMEREVLTY